MAITFSRETQTFLLTTRRTAYAFSVEKGKMLLHRFYGKKGEPIPPVTPKRVSFSPYQPAFGDAMSPDVMPQEFPFFGTGDFRASALKLRDGSGACATDFSFVSHRIFQGRALPEGLPCADADDKTETLAISLEDKVSGALLTLFYTVFPEEDVISRSFELKNGGTSPLKIEKCMSLSLDLPGHDFDRINLLGQYFHERTEQKMPLGFGMQSVCSRRGASSHQSNPAFALVRRGTKPGKGDAFGFNFVYSGSFCTEIEVDPLGNTRVLTGLGEENFGCLLLPGETFSSPEAIMTYSADGRNGMTDHFHAFVRNHILPPSSTDLPHPIVLNTWEACFFDINEEKLLAFADKAASLGMDMLVVDDGWFGNRCDDHRALGDWFVNREKFKNGLASFSEKVHARGLRFGIWIEPEMVSPDSDLFRAHPDRCLHLPGREPSQSRQQLVLDMGNPAVFDYLTGIFSESFRGVGIDYFKWDMNRHLCDVRSAVLPPERQDEAAFRHIKGVYRLLGWFQESFPDAVIETCSGGGGRYDLGMMKYGFQIWASDNTDPFDRVPIQSASLLAYPACTMSCHVSDPRGSLSSLDRRFKVACGGMLGYELNVLGQSEEILSAVKKQIAQYRSFEKVIRTGRYTALDPGKGGAAWVYFPEDGSELLFTLVSERDAKKGETKKMLLSAADPKAVYIDALTGEKISGRILHNGFSLPLAEDTAVLRYWKREN